MSKHGVRLKVVALDVEKQAVDARNKGRTAAEAKVQIDALLKRRGSTETITIRAIQRYWATLDEKTIAPAHEPQMAERNADLSVGVASDIQRLRERLLKWVEEAEEARNEVFDGEEVRDVGPDWRARTQVSKELRETLKLIVDVLERVHNAEAIAVFQQTVYEVVREASPELQREIKRRFESNREIIRAKLLGL